MQDTIRFYNFVVSVNSEGLSMSDIELIATDAPVVRIKIIKEKRIKDKKKNFDKRSKVLNINPRRK